MLHVLQTFTIDFKRVSINRGSPAQHETRHCQSGLDPNGSAETPPKKSCGEANPCYIKNMRRTSRPFVYKINGLRLFFVLDSRRRSTAYFLQSSRVTRSAFDGEIGGAA